MLAYAKYQKITLDYILPFLFILLLLLAIYLALFSSFFSIQKIVCVADYKPCDNIDLLAELDKVKGNNLIRFEGAPLIHKLKSSSYLIKSVEINKRLPSTLYVTTESINPSFAIKIEGGDSWVLTNQDGRVIGSVLDKPNVPTLAVTSLPAIRIGQYINDNHILTAIKMGLALRDSSLNYSDLTLVDEATLSLRLTSHVLVLLALDKEPASQLRTLQAILSDSTIKKESYNTIDVRFAQPVLRQN